MKRITELTGLRCLAVMMVVIGHAQQTTQGGYSGWLLPLKLFSNGYQGVLIFFVLSGFLITSILISEYGNTGKIDFVRFYCRRALRIWPASYAVILAIVLLSAIGLINVARQQSVFAALHLWNYSGPLGLKEVHASHPDGVWYFGHFWSLALEEQFYWVWPPLLIFLLRFKNEKILPGLIILIPIVRMATYVLFPGLRDYLGMMLHTSVDAMLIGCYAALKQEKIKSMMDSSKHTNIFCTISIVILFFAMPSIANNYGGYWNATYGRTVEAILAAVLMLSIINIENFWLSKILRAKIFVFIGTISFSLYLWQQVLLGKGAPLAFKFPFNIIQAVLLASLSYWFIEMPFLRIKNKIKLEDNI
ncbi:acyltransferase family protein [Uliginosibacterium sp. sgz301328]|uniref:acyltransferase family protein n=1 Tax=Uliginosibacterium sp. sgz301328 TaxID=3243764 RepID=UPI00359DB373